MMGKGQATTSKNLNPRLREVISLTDKFCNEHLNDEYRELCRACATEASAARVAIDSGKAASWAAGVISAVAYANFLNSDPTRPFHMSPDEMAKRTGVSPATLQSKSKAIRDALGISRLDPRFSTRELNEQNPLSSLMAMMQQAIACHPARGRSRRREKRKQSGPPLVYTLVVSILSGPITQEFAKKNRTICRTIEIRGDQTLEDLHEAIFDAFDRDDPHMYEFQFGSRPMDPKGPRYVMPEAADDGIDPPPAGITTETTIDDLDLKVGRTFGYWFDFGDDWHHQIDVVSITEGPETGEYPRVTQRIGESPPQYNYTDEEE
jgi:hypothetical protein